jgi:biotin synthase-related radical SAM superfamily protein
VNQAYPEKVRVSVGSAIILGLLRGKLDAAPTTVYLLTYHEGKCIANCGFCPQARTSSSRADMLSRVTWPVYTTSKVVESLASSAGKGTVKRVCIQALNYVKAFNDVLSLTKLIHSLSNVPISVSCQPFNLAQMKELASSGVDHIGIALDAATEGLFEKVKGVSTQSPYTWQKQQAALKEAVGVFGSDHVYSHLIVGLGETEKEMSEIIQWCKDSSIRPSLFAFTPIIGTALEGRVQPAISAYRRIQIARHLIVNGKTRLENMKFNDEGQILDFGVPKMQLQEEILNGSPFRTSGCPECNRPYYNERPGGPMYNYPRQLTQDELSKIEKQLEGNQIP